MCGERAECVQRSWPARIPSRELVCSAAWKRAENLASEDFAQRLDVPWVPPRHRDLPRGFVVERTPTRSRGTPIPLNLGNAQNTGADLMAARTLVRDDPWSATLQSLNGRTGLEHQPAPRERVPYPLMTQAGAQLTGWRQHSSWDPRSPVLPRTGLLFCLLKADEG